MAKNFFRMLLEMKNSHQKGAFIQLTLIVFKIAKENAAPHNIRPEAAIPFISISWFSESDFEGMVCSHIFNTRPTKKRELDKILYICQNVK